MDSFVDETDGQFPDCIPGTPWKKNYNSGSVPLLGHSPGSESGEPMHELRDCMFNERLLCTRLVSKLDGRTELALCSRGENCCGVTIYPDVRKPCVAYVSIDELNYFHDTAKLPPGDRKCLMCYCVDAGEYDISRKQCLIGLEERMNVFWKHPINCTNGYCVDFVTSVYPIANEASSGISANSYHVLKFNKRHFRPVSVGNGDFVFDHSSMFFRPEQHQREPSLIPRRCQYFD